MSTPEKPASDQRLSHLAYAHYQALKYMVEEMRPDQLSAKSALAFFGLAKLKLGEAKTKDFLKLLQKSENCNVRGRLTCIAELLGGHPDLMQGFGMFLPPSLNVLFQTLQPMVEASTDEAMEEVKVETDSPVKVEKADIPNDAYAITFLAKVKERFQDDPEIFERFLNLLDSIRKENTGPQETDVFSEVSELFQGHPDLLEEFRPFVPSIPTSEQKQADSSQPMEIEEDPTNGYPVCSEVNDSSVAPVYKYGSYEEHLFFDKVRSAVGHREVFDNFLRCLMLYNEDVVSRSEVLKLATSFLGKFPSLLRELKEMLGLGVEVEPIPAKIVRLEAQRNDPQVALDIDYATGGRTGASYRALPRDFEQPKCSGRTPLCNEVLNDRWVSFPTWSEDSTFVTSGMTQYEEIVYRCEDERFELDMALSANRHTMELVEGLQRRINKMSPEERSVFCLDDYLGSSSRVLHQRALHRLYGDKTEELVEGLKRNPVVAVPIILKRLKVKEEEWREKQAVFNGVWREQMERFYLRSLDHPPPPHDFRPKHLLAHLHVRIAEHRAQPSQALYNLEFRDASVFQDATVLLLHHLKRMPGVYREDRRRIETLIRCFVPDIFCAPRTPPDEEAAKGGSAPPVAAAGGGVEEEEEESISSDESENSFVQDTDLFENPPPPSVLPYTLFFGGKTWFLFFRQLHLLCERLSRLMHHSRRHDNGAGYISLLQELRGGEETARAIFGIHAHLCTNMDKLANNILRQLQQALCEEGAGARLFAQRLRESDYLRRVQRTTDPLFKITWHKRERVLSVQLVERSGGGAEEESPDPREAERFSDYLDNYLDTRTTSLSFFEEHSVFLHRNLRKQMAYWSQENCRRKRGIKRHYLEDETQVSFSGLRMAFVHNSHTYFHRRPTHTTQVSARRRERFAAWHHVWLERYVTPEMACPLPSSS